MFQIIKVSSEIQLPTYYLIICVTAIICLMWAVHRSHRLQLHSKETLDLGLLIMIFGFIGGRLFHVFYESFDHYQEDYRRIFYIWNGGFVFYGGAVLAALAGITYLYFKAYNQIENYLDLLAPVLALGYSLGRVACFLAGCCYGRSCELPWAIANRHPTQLYAVFWELGVVFLLLAFEKSRSQFKYFKISGRIFYSWMVLHGIGRLIMEAFRADFRGPILGASVSTWLSWSIIAFGTVLLLKKPLDSDI